MGAPDTMFSSLTPAEQYLTRLMQSLGCGKLRNVPVHNGQPAFEAPMTVVRLVKLRPGEADQPSFQPPTTDFPLRREVLRLLHEIRAVKEGIVERLEVVHGLPTMAELAEPVTPHPRRTSTPTPGR